MSLQSTLKINTCWSSQTKSGQVHPIASLCLSQAASCSLWLRFGPISKSDVISTAHCSTFTSSTSCWREKNAQVWSYLFSFWLTFSGFPMFFVCTSCHIKCLCTCVYYTHNESRHLNICGHCNKVITTWSSFPCHSISPSKSTSLCFLARRRIPTSLFEIVT